MENPFRTAIFSADTEACRLAERAVAASGVEVYPCTSDIDDLIALCASKAIHLIVMEALPRLPTITAAAAALHDIHRGAPHVKILMFSKDFDPDYVDAVLRQGICGYLLSQSLSKEFPQIVHLLRAGKIILSPEITRALITRH